LEAQGFFGRFKMKSMIRMKICCIGSIAEAQTAISFGASAIGLVAKMPSGQEVISDDQIAKIAKTIPPHVAIIIKNVKSHLFGVALKKTGKIYRVQSLFEVCYSRGNGS
jgi:phosphoribosylanthranilate isomerase